MAAGDVVASVKQNNGKKCISFDGINNYCTAGTKFRFTNTESWTTGFWFKSVDRIATQSIFMESWDGSSGWSITITTAGKIDFSIYSAGNVTITSTNAFDDDKWHHVFAVRNVETDKIQLYIDNVSAATDATDATTGTIPLTATTMYVGCESGGGGRFVNGKMADIKIWNVVLTAAEMTNVYTGIKVIRGLISVWDFSTNTYDDNHGNRNLTNVGTVIQIVDDTIANQLKTMRITKNDKWLLADVENGQVMLTNIEEAP